MGPRDWQSLDLFPERAGYVRILTDRLREDFRALHQVSRDVQPSTREALTACPALPENEEKPDPPEAMGRLAAILERACIERRPLPLTGSNGTASDVLIDVHGREILLRLVDLGDGEWRLTGDSLAPWLDAGGGRRLSPCRQLWRRLTVLRALDGAGAPEMAVVVLPAGRFADEQAVARAVQQDRQKTGVDLVWLDRDRGVVPHLAAWLTAAETGMVAAHSANPRFSVIQTTE
jgi:hypothetical protein